MGRAEKKIGEDGDAQSIACDRPAGQTHFVIFIRQTRRLKPKRPQSQYHYET